MTTSSLTSGEARALAELDRDIARGIAEMELKAEVPLIPITALGPSWGSAHYRWDDGEKFYGGFGPTEVLIADYWSLRARSAALFESNLYARGIVRRFVTNVINTGLHLECIPEESILGFEQDELADWSENVEIRWNLWEVSPWLCDHREQQSFGEQQATAYIEALVCGDVLCVMRQDSRTGLPRIQLISGEAVQTPLDAEPPRGNRIIHGVEIDAQKRHVAYWVTQEDGTSKRLPAWGEKSGRRIAWLVYGTDKRLDDVRGKPLLSLILQSLKEIDRYRDAVQRKAVINSMLALFIKKSSDKMSTLPLSGGAVTLESITQQGPAGTPRSFKMAELIPGLMLEELQQGEEPQGFDSKGIDEKFGEFEESIVQAIAWALETPPEILRLSFSNNYSASQAAINEFVMFLHRERARWGAGFCSPIYQEWLVSQVLNGRIAAPGLLDAWRDLAQYDVFGAWVSNDWAGQIKPAVDRSKLVRAYDEMVASGYMTRDRAARELTGTKFSRNVKRLRIENEQLREANAPLEKSGANADDEATGLPMPPRGPRSRAIERGECQGCGAEISECPECGADIPAQEAA